MKNFAIILVLFLISPYLILIFNFPELEISNATELISVFDFTFKQAAMSALISLFFGFFVGLSLSSMVGKKQYKFFEAICYLPCFVPTLFIVFSGLNISQWFSFSMQGFWGIVLLHVAINVGLVGALYARVIVGRTSTVNRLSLAYGLGPLTYIFRVIIPMTIKDLFFLFSVIFIFCFTSFSIPLMIGGVGSTTIELLIYEKLMMNNDVSQSLAISLLQFSFVLVFLFIFNLFSSVDKRESQSWLPFLNVQSFVVVPSLISGLLLVGLFAKLSYALGFFGEADFLWLILQSLLLALISGYIMFLFCQFIFSLFPSRLLEKFLSSYSSPSTVLVGLSFVILVGSWDQLNWIALLVAYLILFFPAFFKMFVQSFLVDFKCSLKLAQVMGAGYWLRLKMISFPLAYPICLFLAFLTAVWVMGDYAVSSFFIEGEQTLALHAKSLIRSYQMNQASLVVLVILICEVFIYFIYKGLMYVSRQKH